MNKVYSSFLTDTHDLFVIGMTIDLHYEIYQIDLDSSSPYLVGPILRYSYKQVDYKSFLSFHKRGSSSKEKINLNKKLIVFV